ncbi:MAG: ABC transporter ATP-binding protein [Treponema sp.]|nr:ABC transporter ATP-binding protein [Treponema sp.]
MALLECKNLCVGYGSKIVQENLNFSVEKGDYFFIIGENGSGKSTLMKTLLGFIKPLDGSIEYSSEWNRKGIGYLPQASEIQKTFPATVWEIVISGCQSSLGLFPFYKKSAVLNARKNMERLGIQNFAKKGFKELSGGQQQRVLLARTLCAASSVLVLDEPAKGFDSEITETMYKLVYELNKDGMTVITISHDLDAASEYGNKILKLGKSWEITFNGGKND